MNLGYEDAILELAIRLHAVETRQRDREWHDPACPVRQTEIAQRRSGAYLISPPCDCWLAENSDEH